MTSRRFAVPLSDYERILADRELVLAERDQLAESLTRLVERLERESGWADHDDQAALCAARALLADIKRRRTC